MVDFTLLTEKIATGAQVTSADDVAQLVLVGITAVVDARAEFDDAAMIMATHLLPPLGYCYDPTADDGVHPKPVEWFARALDFALPLIVRPHRNLVLFHCAAGVNRGPSLAYATLRVLGWSAHDALLLIFTKRPVTRGGIAYADDAELALKQLGYI